MSGGRLLIPRPPEGTMAYEFAKITWLYCKEALNDLGNYYEVRDIRQFRDSLNEIANTAYGRKSRLWLSGNDIRYFLTSFLNWLGMDELKEHADILRHYADNIKKLLTKDSRFTVPSLLKVNFYEYKRRMGHTGAKTELLMDGNQILLCIAGALLSRCGRTSEGKTVYLLLPQTRVIRVSDEDRIRWELVRDIISRLLGGKEQASTATVLLYISAVLSKEGAQDGSYAALALVQETGNRATLLSLIELSTHSLISLIKGDKAEDAIINMMESYAKALKNPDDDLNRNIIRVIDMLSQNILSYSLSGSYDALNMAVSTLRRGFTGLDKKYEKRGVRALMDNAFKLSSHLARKAVM